MAFILSFGLYELIISSFGLCNALSTFLRHLNHIFSDIIDQYILVYLHDISVYSKTTDNHEKHLHEVIP